MLKRKELRTMTFVTAGLVAVTGFFIGVEHSLQKEKAFKEATRATRCHAWLFNEPTGVDLSGYCAPWLKQEVQWGMYDQ